MYVASRDGTNFRLVQRDEEYQWHGSPSISLDGKQLAWNAHQSNLTSLSVFIGDLDGHVAHKIVGATRPVWPDDQALLLEKDRKTVKLDLDQELKQEVLLEG